MKSTIYSAYYVLVAMWKDSLEGYFPDNIDLTAPFIEDLNKIVADKKFEEFIQTENGKIFVDLLQEQLLYTPIEDEEETEEHIRTIRGKFIRVLEKIVDYPLKELEQEIEKHSIL